MMEQPSATPLSLPAPAPALLADPKVAQLRAIFPEIEPDVLDAFLSFHGGSVEAVAAAILEADPAADDAAAREEIDVQVAREAQLELDDQCARALQESLSREEAEEAERRRQRELSTRALAAASSATAAATAGAKKLMSSAMAVARPLTARAKRDHGTRLLDGPLSSDADVTPLGPLSAQPYASPLSPLYMPPAPPTAPTAPTAPDTPAPLAPLASPPTTSSTSAPGASADKYNSRVQRARAANRQSGRASTSDAVSPTLAPLPTAVHVPEGELI